MVEKLITVWLVLVCIYCLIGVIGIVRRIRKSIKNSEEFRHAAEEGILDSQEFPVEE